MFGGTVFVSIALFYMVGLGATVLASMSMPVRAKVAAGNITEDEPEIELKPGTPWSAFDFFAVVILVVFSAGRHNVGTDYWMYAEYFRKVQPEFWQWEIDHTTQEFGYTFLSLVVKSVTTWPPAMFWLTSVLTVVPIYYVIKKRSTNPALAVFLFVFLSFYVAPFNIVRQGVAIALNFLSTLFIDRSKTMFVALNVLAALFHASVIIVAIIEFVTMKVKPSPARFCALLLGALVAAYLFLELGFLTYVAELVNPRYNQYLDTDAAGIGTYLLIAVHIGLVSLCLYAGRISDLTARYVTWAGVGTAFLIIGTQSVVWARMEMYFAIFLILAIPAAWEKLPRGGWLRFGVATGSLAYFGFYLLSYSDLLPYNFKL